MKRFGFLVLLSGVLTGTHPAQAAPPTEESQQVLQGSHRVVGTVQQVKSEQIQVDTGEVQPRYIPLKQAKEKGMASVKEGDRIEITLNEQNLIVDYHLVDADGQRADHGHHEIITGHIAQPLTVGHDRAVIRTQQGKEQTYEIRSPARSKMSAIPIGTNAVFLLDETGKIVDVNVENSGAVSREGAMSGKKSPPKGAQRRIVGTIVGEPATDRVTIRTGEGREQPYQVRPLVSEKLSGLSKGQPVVLLIDEDDKVVDVAVTPGR